MGIAGLLPFLKSIQHPTNVSAFHNQVVVIDAYCWLHKGCYSCPLELIEGRETEMRYVHYCMRKVNMLIANNVTPILVFDGAHLPSKQLTEEKRRKQRHIFKEKGLRLLREGKKKEAYDCFKHCVDVKPELALNLINACRERGIQCIVAPYESDAQLAYMVKTGLAYAVISEDSDLLVFGCERVLFKMDDSGNGFLVNLSEVGNVKGHNMLGFSEDSFRHMCILSGCDYLESIPGVGLVTAHKLMRKYGFDPIKVIRNLRYEKPVPDKYEENFKQADMTFLYQIVFDPVTESQVPLTQIPPEVDMDSLTYAGLQVTPTKAKALARGNINPITNSIMGDYTPSKGKQVAQASYGTGAIEKHQKTMTSFVTTSNRQSKRCRDEPEVDSDQLMRQYSTYFPSKTVSQVVKEPATVNAKKSVFSVGRSSSDETCVYSRFFPKPTESSFEVKPLAKIRISKEVILPDITKLRTLSLPFGDNIEITEGNTQDEAMPSQTESVEMSISVKNTQNSVELTDNAKQKNDNFEQTCSSPSKPGPSSDDCLISPDLLDPKTQPCLSSPDLLSCNNTRTNSRTFSNNSNFANPKAGNISDSTNSPCKSSKDSNSDFECNLITCNQPRNPFTTPSKSSPVSIVIPETPEIDRHSGSDTELKKSSRANNSNSQPITSKYFSTSTATKTYRQPLTGSGKAKRRPLTGYSRQTALDIFATKSTK